LNGCRADFLSRFAYKDAIMATRRRNNDPFIIEGIDGSNDWPTEQEILDGWRARMTKIVEAFKNEPPKSIKGRQAIDAQDAINQLDIIERVSFRPQVLLATVSLGILFERMTLRGIEPWIGKSPRVSKANAKRAKDKAILTTGEQRKVISAITKQQSSGVSIREACKRISRQLKTGVFNPINRRVPIEAEGIRSIWNRLNHRE
jgi:hypothetical protein